MKNMSRQTSLYGILVVVGIFQTSVQSLKFYQNGNFECSTNGTLTCKSETLPVNSALYINGLTIVICEEGQCIVNPLTPSIYVVEHDYSKGVINVTVLSVSTNISNTLFRCDGDSTFMTIGPNINVTVTPSSFVVDVIQETENTSIQAVTGCAKPSTIFIFKWFMSKDNNWNGEVMTELTYKPFKTENDTYCHPEGHCNGTGIASTITFPTPAKDKREAYYVHCVVYVSDIPTVANTTTRLVWLPEVIISNNVVSDGNMNLVAILVPTLIGIVLLITLIIVVACCCTSKKQGDKRAVCKCEPSTKLFTFRKIDCDRFLCCDKTSKYCPKFRVNDVPVTVESILLRTIQTENSITCTWDKEFKSKLKVQISYKNIKTNEPNDWVLTAVDKKKRTCTINKLQPGTSYSLVMKAIDSRSQTTDESDLIIVTTLGAALPPTDFDYDPKSLESTSVTVLWVPANYKREVQHFIISFKRKKRKKDKWLYTPKVKDNGKDVIKYKIKDLDPNTTYMFTICAKNNIGKSKESQPIYVKTKVMKPLPPKKFEFLNIEDDKVTVSWEPSLSVSNQMFYLTYYNMSAQTSRGDGNELFVKYESPLMTKLITGLQKNSLYQFEISTYIGKKRSISLIDSVQTLGTTDAAEMQQTGRKLTTTELHVICNA